MGIAGASASVVGNAQTQAVNNSTVQEKVTTPADNTNSTNKSVQNAVSSNLNVNQTLNSTLQVSTKSTTQTTVNSTTKSTNNSQTVSSNKTTVSAINGSVQKPEAVENQGFSALQIENLQAAAGTTKTAVVTSTSFTLSQINDAAARVKAYIETNHVLPNYVTIGTTQVKMPDFLKLLTAGLLQLNNGTTTPITLKTVAAPAQSSENVTSGNITKANYLDLAKRVNAFIDANGIVPNYATSTLGKLRYESLIYMYSKILNYYKTNSALPSYVTVNAWSTVTKSVLAQARTVYITSDYVDGTTTDTNRINAIVNGLKALGITAINAGLGTNTHYSALQNSSVPANALIVDIYGGADAGVIYEMGQSYYKKLVGSKKVFCVWLPSSVNITGLAWLPRAHDDNYDPASFTGLAHPDQYLLNNGYNYIYSGDLNAIIAAIYKQATT